MGEGRGDLIAVAQLKRIEEVEPDRRHADHDLPFLGGRIRDLFDAKLLRSAELAELRHTHGFSLLLLACPRQAAAYGMNPP